MKKILGFAMLSFALFACGGNKSEQDAAADSARIADSIAQVEAAAAADMERFVGTYAGVIPAADAEGFEIMLVLNADKTFAIEEKVKGGKDDGAGFTSTGAFLISGDTVSFTVEGEPSPRRLVLNATADSLQFDGVQDEKMAPFYVLAKQK
ncbi:copper resistance protein NlpE N-terminal domain-containing protein [Porphyromonas gulae]|uniref:copper resistance protein NlpE N-terminal domain-containing protein n=1 Tax=Porphyromonas gulae TaxID=111105 RepID=UPI0026ED5133|nr:copper resistance protein NlpE N-terminal domain-containing protein [Porphyromonas gulae]